MAVRKKDEDVQVRGGGFKVSNDQETQCFSAVDLCHRLVYCT